MVSWAFLENWESRESCANTKTSVEKNTPSLIKWELASPTVAPKHPEWTLTLAPVYLFLESLDLQALEVELVTLVRHSSQQLSDAGLLRVDHLLGGNHKTLIGRIKREGVLEQKNKGRINPKRCIIKNN